MTDLVPLPTQPVGLAWPTSKWQRGEFDPRVDASAVELLLAAAFTESDELGVGETNAVLIVHRGRIVAERYADGQDATTTHISWSMAKSVLHAIVGVLVREGALDIAAPAEVPEWREPDDSRARITLDELLKMRSGLRFREDYVDGSASDVIEMLFGRGKSDVAAFAAGLPLLCEPGSSFSYSSGTSNIIAAIVAREVERLAGPAHPGGRAAAIEAFLERELFGPLGIHSATLRHDDVGTWIASSFVFATARDFARFGLLYLRDGIWADRRLLPVGWVDHARTLTAEPLDEQHAYGAHFWLVPGPFGIFQAQGYNGQRLTLVPALDLIVVRLGVTPADQAEALNAFMQRVVDAFGASA